MWGKSTLALDIARSAAIHHQMTTVFFSLEMSRTELAMRILSAEGKISMGHLKKGDLDTEGWTNLATLQGRIDSAPLFIDDSTEYDSDGDSCEVPSSQAA